MRLLPDGFDTVDELYTEDQLRQLVVAVEAAPALLGRLGELEDHGERRLVRETSLRAHGSMAHGREGAFDGVRGSQVLPMLGGEVVERQQRLAVPGGSAFFAPSVRRYDANARASSSLRRRLGILDTGEKCRGFLSQW